MRVVMWLMTVTWETLTPKIQSDILKASLSNVIRTAPGRDRARLKQAVWRAGLNNPGGR